MSAAAPETRLIAGRQWRVENGILQMQGANLRYADLRSADLRSANMTGADLTGADLTGANMMGANMMGANLRYADLRSADLRSANMTGADLTGANLSGAYLPFRFVHIPSGGVPMRNCWAWITDEGAEVHMGCHTGKRAFPSFEAARDHYTAADYGGAHFSDTRQVLAALDYAEKVVEMRRGKL